MRDKRLDAFGLVSCELHQSNPAHYEHQSVTQTPDPMILISSAISSPEASLVRIECVMVSLPVGFPIEEPGTERSKAIDFWRFIKTFLTINLSLMNQSAPFRVTLTTTPSLNPCHTGGRAIRVEIGCREKRVFVVCLGLWVDSVKQKRRAECKRDLRRACRTATKIARFVKSRKFANQA